MATGSARMSRAGMLQQLRVLAQGSFGIPLLLLTVLAMMMLPMPPLLLDVLFTFNIALSLVVLLVAVYALRPLDFAVFPTVLLVDHAAAPGAQRRLDPRGAARTATPGRMPRVT